MFSYPLGEFVPLLTALKVNFHLVAAFFFFFLNEAHFWVGRCFSGMAQLRNGKFRVSKVSAGPR